MSVTLVFVAMHAVCTAGKPVAIVLRAADAVLESPMAVIGVD